MPDLGVEIQSRSPGGEGTFIIPPVSGGFRAWHWTRNNAAYASYNWARGGRAAQIIGTPDYATEPGMAGLLTGVNYMRMRVTESADAFTWIILVKTDDELTGAAETQPMLMNTRTNTTDRGSQIWLSDPTVGSSPPAGRGRAIVRSSANDVLAVEVADLGTVKALMLRVEGRDSGAAIRLNETIELAANSNTLSGARIPSHRKIEVGGPFSSWGGAFFTPGFGVWDTAFTDMQADDTMAWLEAELAHEGISTGS